MVVIEVVGTSICFSAVLRPAALQHIHGTCDGSTSRHDAYTASQKEDIKLLMVTLSILNRFSKFFHF